MNPTPRELLAKMFTAAVNAAQPEHCIPRFLPEAPKGRTIVIGAGKASAAMAQALERHWPGPLEGLVVTRYGYAVPCERIDTLCLLPRVFSERLTERFCPVATASIRWAVAVPETEPPALRLDSLQVPEIRPRS